MMNLNTLTNSELFRLYVEKGSKDAINIFFQNQMDLFYRVAFKYTKNAADAEDVLQSAFLSIMDTAYQFKGLQSNEEKLLQSWCLSVVVHCSLMKIRSDSNRRNRETNYSNANTKTLYEENNMEKNSENDAIHKKVQNAIFQLPEKYRVPIHLKYVEGFELDAIANILKLNGNTLRSLIKRGLEKISAQLKEENVTLSSIGLIGFIEGLPMEKAPFTYQSIAAKMVETAKNSQRILSNSSTHAAKFTSKTIITFATISVMTVGGYYGWKINKSTESIQTNSTTKIESFLSREANQSWDFAKESERNLTLLEGKWQWKKEQNGMVTKTNERILISLPIAPQNKAFVIEFKLRAVVEVEKIDGINIYAYWVRDNIVLEHEYFLAKDLYSVKSGALVKNAKIYYYNGYIYNFIEEKCYQISKYSQDLNGANLSLASINFVFEKISCRTLDSTPQILIDALEIKDFKKSELHEDQTIRIDNKE